jgi:hypothetical protein
VTIGVTIAPPVFAVDQIAEVVFATAVEFKFHPPTILPGVSERQTLPIPAIEIPDQVDLISPD